MLFWNRYTSEDKRITDDYKKFWKNLDERFSPSNSPTSPRNELYAGQFKNPYKGNKLSRKEAKNRFVAMLQLSIIFIIVSYFSHFNTIVVMITAIVLIFTLIEYIFYDTARTREEVERTAEQKQKTELRLYPQVIKEYLIEYFRRAYILYFSDSTRDWVISAFIRHGNSMRRSKLEEVTGMSSEFLNPVLEELVDNGMISINNGSGSEDWTDFITLLKIK